MTTKKKTAWVLSVRYAGEKGDPWNIFSSYDYYHSYLQALALTAFRGSMTAATQMEQRVGRGDGDQLDALNSELAGRIRIEKIQPIGLKITKLDEACKGDTYFLHPESVLVESDAEAETLPV